ncbi:hypothetical protein ACLMAB_18610 [Brevibacillus laterosporus]
MVDSNHGWKIARWLDGRRVMLAHGDELVEQQFERYETEHGARRTAQFRYASLQLLMSAPSHIIVKYRGKKPWLQCMLGLRTVILGRIHRPSKTFVDMEMLQVWVQMEGLSAKIGR